MQSITSTSLTLKNWPVTLLRAALRALAGGLVITILATPGWAQQLVRRESYVTPPAINPLAPLNLHLIISEEFLNRYVSRENVQEGEIRETFQDTPVEGRQVTHTKFRVDLQPSQTEGQFQVVLDGDTANNTAGYAPQAVVTSVGHVDFRATKQILFDGFQLATRPAQVDILRFENRNTGAVTKFTGGPLGPIAEQVVLGVADRRQPATEVQARRRVVQRVSPRFDGQIDELLSKANKLLKETVQERLKAANLMPERVRVRSTETHLNFALSLAVPLDMQTIAAAPDELVAEHGISCYLHESLLQGIADRANLAGRRVSVKELKERLNFQERPDNDRTLGGMADLDVEIEFAKVDPLIVRVGEDETRVTIRAAFKPAGQNILPPLEVTIPYRLEQRDDKWILKTGSVDVRTLESNSDGSSMAEVAVKTAIEASLPQLDFPKQLPASAIPDAKESPSVNSIRSGNGWLVIGVD